MVPSTRTPLEETMSERTKAELLEKAGELGIEGRTQMSKDELQRAVDQAEQEEQDNGPEEQEPESDSDDSGSEDGTVITPAHERSYTPETAQQHKEDFGSQNQGAALEGRGVPGVA